VSVKSTIQKFLARSASVWIAALLALLHDDDAPLAPMFDHAVRLTRTQAEGPTPRALPHERYLGPDVGNVAVPVAVAMPPENETVTPLVAVIMVLVPSGVSDA
jgi:hypothetical protein